MKLLLSLYFLLISPVLFALPSAPPYFCEQSLESLPIQQNGRVKPLYVHAKEALRHLTGKTKYKDYSAVQTYCLLTLESMGIPASIDLETPVQQKEVQELLGMSTAEKSLSFSKLVESRGDLVREYRLQKEDNSKKKTLNELLSKITLFQEIRSGRDWMLAEKVGQEIQWTPFISYLTEDKVKAAEETRVKPFLAVLENSQKNYNDIHGDHYRIELIYAKAHLPGWSLLLTLLALAAMVLFKKFNMALLFASATAIAQIALVAFRVYISGRAPITNMYETVMFSGLGALLLAMIIGHFKNEKIFVYMGLMYNACTLMMLNFGGGMLTDAINPLVPVLRDNFWLSTHVTTVILSYGALALSWVLANTALIKKRFGKLDEQEEVRISNLIYTCLKYGTVMLAAGVILGGVWADYSWGRFWGWDPKETWSLIVLCLYMAILHGRYTSWIPAHRFIPLTALAFLSVMMAWFGVNYILATGLHSYGFSEGGAVFLGTFFIVQIALLIFTFKGFKREQMA